MGAIAVVRAVLVAAGPVTALVSDRIFPLRRTQSMAVPAITLQRSSIDPQNHLRGWADLDANTVQLDVLADSYASATAIAAACRTALQAAGHLMNSEIDLPEPEVDPELYRITQAWQVWTT